MEIQQFFLEGLGHQSYIISDDESGAAAWATGSNRDCHLTPKM
ncbi:MAG: hypothetical protein WCD86_24980 [Ktedonobacteraceae bacterium]